MAKTNTHVKTVINHSNIGSKKLDMTQAVKEIDLYINRLLEFFKPKNYMTQH